MIRSSIVVDDGEIIGVTSNKAAVGKNKEAAGTTAGMVTEASWIEFVFLSNPPAGIVSERKAEPATVGVIRKERVPDAFMDRLTGRRVFKKLPPIDATASAFYSRFPKTRDSYLSHMARWNYLIDLHVDVVRQHADKGFAEVGIDFTDDGVKNIFILPQHYRIDQLLEQRN